MNKFRNTFNNNLEEVEISSDIDLKVKEDVQNIEPKEVIMEIKSEGDNSSSDSSDYKENKSIADFSSQQLQNHLRNLRNNKVDDTVFNELQKERTNIIDNNSSNANESEEIPNENMDNNNADSTVPSNENINNQESSNPSMKDSLSNLSRKKITNLAKQKIFKGGKMAAEGAAEGATDAAGATAAEGTAIAAGATAAEGTAAATGLAALAANPVFWIVILVIILILFLLIGVIIIWAVYSNSRDDSDSNNYNYSGTNGSCNYVLNGEEIQNLKVRLLTCDGSKQIDGEGLIDFDKYVMGVTYAEHADGNTESWKVQAIAAKSYALRRPDQMGNQKVKFTEENGQKILNIRNCTNDQVYCDPDQGCWSDSSTAGSTVYSGYKSNKAWKKPILAENSDLRTAVNEVKDKILVDSNNNIYYATYVNTNQNRWKSQAKQGKTYNEILTSDYSNSKVSTISCSSEYASSGGNCITSTPIKISSNESFVITSRFGYRTAPTAGASSNHKGLDLGYPLGTPVYSVFDGTVTVAQSGYGSAGNAVLIAHDLNGDGKTDYITEYFHLSKYNVKVGDKVSGGEKIGEVGSTGASTGPHLHFGLKKGDGTYIDPEKVLNDMRNKKSVFDNASVCKNSSKYTATFPYYNQCDDKWKNHKICDKADYSNGQCVSSSTICSSGCGYTSFSMIASGFNHDSNIKPDNVVDFVSQYSYNSGGGAIQDETLVNKNVLDRYNLKAEVLFERNGKTSLKDKKDKIVKALESGKAVELLVPGHFVALVNIQNGKILLNDPGNSSNVGSYTIDELHSLFKKKRCPKCADNDIFVHAVAYSRK